MQSTVHPKKKIVSIQVCRGIAALIVVLAHLANVEEKYFTSRIMAPFHFGVAGVDIFFVISGVVISIVTLDKFGNARAAGKFLYHRVARIYPTYWLYTLIALFVFLLHPGWVNAKAHGHVEIARSFLLIPSHYAYPIVQGWTLAFEMYFYILFFVLMFLPEKIAPWALTLYALTVVTMLHAGLLPVNIFTSVYASPMLFEFIMGCILFRLYRRSRLHPAFGVLLLVAAVAWLACAIYWSHAHYGDYGLWDGTTADHRVMWCGPFAVLLVAGLMELERTGLVRFTKPLMMLGDWSYSIYLSHIIVVEFFGRTFLRWGTHLPMPMLWVDMLSLPMVILAGWLSYRLVEVPLIRLLYRSDRKPVFVHNA